MRVAIVVACAAGLAASACSATVDESTSSTVPASVTVTLPTPTTTTVASVTSSDRYGLPQSVTASVVAPELELVLDIAVEPGAAGSDDISLFGRFASCSAVEGPDWLPLEVVVDEGVGAPSLRLVAAASTRQSEPSAAVRVRVDNGAGTVVEASGGVAFGADERTGTWSAVTDDGHQLTGTFACEGEPHEGVDPVVAEVSVRMVDTATGVTRTVGARSTSATCAIGGSAGTLLRIDDADQPAGGLIAIDLSSPVAVPIGSSGTGTLVLTVPDGGLRFSTITFQRIPGGGVLSGDDGAGRRVDGAWSCQ
jgi:hypothetical protein